ncbi:MAG: hypothetical protein P8P74_16045 [Crocinitomicaceae bacterium]|nr:hypothetical protein [Crocinitomicaceae bacterium]
MKENTKTWLLMLILVPIVSGVYGIFHDQITYSISPEYFTHFKFNQFKIDQNLRDSERLAAALVGFLATWWIGIPLAVILGIVPYKKLDPTQYRLVMIQSVKVVFITAVILGVVGYLVGLYVASKYADWPMNFSGPIDVTQIKNWDNFWVVGTIHNFSYIGALVGLIVALFRQFRAIKRAH